MMMNCPSAGNDHYDYTPAMPTELWTRIAPFVREMVRAAAPGTPYSQKQLYPVMAMMARWAVETAGYPLKVKMIFHPSTVDRFSRQGLSHYTTAGRATMRSKLRSMSTALLGEDREPDRDIRIQRSDPQAPYAEPELAALLSWCSVQHSPERRSSAKALLALGLGAGLTGREICSIAAANVEVDGDGILIYVPQPTSRRVPVIREWEGFLRERLEYIGHEGWVFRSGQAGSNANLITDFVTRSNQRVPLRARRMRATWLVRHLSAGTPLPALLEAAGLKSGEALDRLLPFVKPADDELTTLWLREV